MKHTTLFTIALLPIFALPMPGCDSPDDEAELAALEVEDEELQVGNQEAKDNERPALKEFDLEANMSVEGPEGKCCKAICSWDPGPNHWHQLPPEYQHAGNCNYWAVQYCTDKYYGPGPGLSHVEDAQWRTCGG